MTGRAAHLAHALELAAQVLIKAGKPGTAQSCTDAAVYLRRIQELQPLLDAVDQARRAKEEFDGIGNRLALLNAQRRLDEHTRGLFQ